MPDSICFIETLDEIGSKYPDKIITSISQIRLWIFRHYVWLALGLNGKPDWIGVDIYTEDSNQFLFHRNPFMRCRCGSNKLYYDCHLIPDYNLALLNRKTPPLFTMQNQQFNLKLYCDTFIKENAIKKESYNKIKKLLLS